ncbi:MAG: CinA family protein [Kiritimatiellia bacterium]
MENILIKDCTEKNLSVAVAESCTGGLLGARIVNVPGASKVFKGGVLSYADEVKRHLLNVPENILKEDGAVSAACAEAMAQGVRRLMNTDLAVAVTGIAGPSGGSDEKPVGLVYLCAVTEKAVLNRGCNFEGSRLEIRRQAVDAALKMMIEIIQ